MTTPDTKITNRIIGTAKGIPPNIIAMMKSKNLPFSKQPINTTEALLRGLKFPILSGTKHSKKKVYNTNGNVIGIHGPGSKKPAHTPDVDLLFGENNNNFVEVPSNPKIDKNANNIASYSMNSGVGLDKNWTVVFAHDVVIPVGNPMAPVLALTSSGSDTLGPISRQPSAQLGPISSNATTVFNEPSTETPLSILVLVRLKAQELMTDNNISIDHLFMNRP